CCPGIRAGAPGRCLRPIQPGTPAQYCEPSPGVRDTTESWPGPPRECWKTSGPRQCLPLLIWSAALHRGICPLLTLFENVVLHQLFGHVVGFGLLLVERLADE